MVQHRPSRTAEGMAILRAIEAQKPEAKRICHDSIAYALVSRISVALSKMVIDSGLYDRIAPGAVAFITARERFIDDYLRKCLKEGLDQVVILGAGFDTRAYRIERIEKTQVYEIDHPGTQEVKIRRLKKIFDPLPGHVTFVPLDFNTQSLGEGLINSGYDERGKTLFIWQGVTVYLTPEGVDSTLAFVANHSGEGSSVIFDYFYNETLRDTSRPEVRMMQKAARVTGEGYLFGIDRDGIEPFLAQRGFDNIHNTTSKDLKRLYFSGPNAGRVLPEGCDIVSASVKPALTRA